MEQLPIHISIVFILTTLATILLLFKATHYSKVVMSIVLIWLAIQMIIGLSGFYTVTDTMPPRFPFLIFPPLIVIFTLLFTKKRKEFILSIDAKTATLIHIVRIPVELTLYWLFIQKVIPGLITFEGRNFDILCGITAPFIYYFGYVRNTLGRKIVIAWNIICLTLLANVVITAVLSIPLPFQQFAFDQPNIALLYFPFVWLPCCVVPVVVFAHAASLKQLLNK